ncbi:hypothetical protein U6G28_07060 [Actinomycetaceae bacterium MB13-C1-2]|nr:hypothetical protein U6G28_07060 [Actinomycetaceae bacterium MB13-C1-2]
MSKKLSTATSAMVALLLITSCSSSPAAAPDSSNQSEPTVQEEEKAPASGPSSPADVQSEETAEDESSEQQISIPWLTDETVGEPVAPVVETALVTGMRLAEHDDFDRIVIDLQGDTSVGWTTRWTDNPVEEGRGEPLVISGNEFLDIAITGTRIPETDEDWSLVYDDFSAKATGEISAIYDGTYEGRSHVVIGMTQKAPYRIFQLSNPSRVVIDIQRVG